MVEASPGPLPDRAGGSCLTQFLLYVTATRVEPLAPTEPQGQADLSSVSVSEGGQQALPVGPEWGRRARLRIRVRQAGLERSLWKLREQS